MKFPRETVYQVRNKTGDLLYKPDQFRKLISNLGGEIHPE
jgi:hypothetical protein